MKKCSTLEKSEWVGFGHERKVIFERAIKERFKINNSYCSWTAVLLLVVDSNDVTTHFKIDNSLWLGRQCWLVMILDYKTCFKINNSYWLSLWIMAIRVFIPVKLKVTTQLRSTQLFGLLGIIRHSDTFIWVECQYLLTKYFFDYKKYDIIRTQNTLILKSWYIKCIKVVFILMKVANILEVY